MSGVAVIYLGLILTCFAFVVVTNARIAENHGEPYKKWVVYSMFFHIAASGYIVFKYPLTNKERTKEFILITAMVGLFVAGALLEEFTEFM